MGELKSLRIERKLTQNQAADILGVSLRSYKSYENDEKKADSIKYKYMIEKISEINPSLLVDIAEFFNVSIPEIINGERKSEIMEKEVKEVAEAMSNYAGAEKSVILKRVKLISIIGLISLVIGLVMEAINYDSMIPIYECMKGTCLGLGVGALATMVLYTTGILEKIKNRKSKQMKIVAIFGSGIIAICIIVSLILTIIEFLS